MTAVDRSPARLTGTLALVAAAIAVFLPGLYSWLALVVGVAGFVSLGVGLAVARQTGVTAGATALFAGVVLAGIDGAPAPVLLFGAVSAVLAWDSATTAIGVGEQLGRAAATGRAEFVRTATTGLVGLGSAAIAYLIYAVVAWNASMTGVVLLVLAIVLLAAFFR